MEQAASGGSATTGATPATVARKLYLTALALAAGWALYMIGIGLIECWPRHPPPLAPDERYFTGESGNVITSRRTEPFTTRLFTAGKKTPGSYAYRPSTAAEIAAYEAPLTRPFNVESFTFFLTVGLAPGLGLIALRRWWRWLRAP